MSNKYKWILPAVIILASCRVTKKYSQQELSDNVRYRSALSVDSTNIAGIGRKEFFSDTVLQKLITESISSNLDLKIAYQRIISSRAAFWRSKQAFLPEAGLTGNVKRAKVPFTQGFGFINDVTQFDIGVNTAWEADIWGRLSSAKRGTYADLMATEAARNAVRTQLIADIANYYIQLLSLDEQLTLLHKTAANRAEDVATMESLNASNKVNGAAVVQSKANYSAAKVAIPDVSKQIRETENVLCILLNRVPGQIERGSLHDFRLPESFSSGVPSDLLKNRPDVRQAEYQLRAAFEHTNVARTNFYPSIKITGGAGFSTFDFSQWFSVTSLFANVIGGLTQPLLAGGENRAKLKVAISEQEIALLNFQKVMLQAVQEVSNALFSIETATEKQQERREQLEYLEKSVEFTKELLKYNSSTNYTDVLTSENNLLNAQNSDIGDKVQKLQGIVQLYRALGGGNK
ncbi:efflux transporter outer membrane subunit [Chitinophagaceae bacterium LWZ2-11]